MAIPKPSGSNIYKELIDLCQEKSHPEYPYLRSDYSPTSRYPAIDFTPWIASKLLEKRYDDIAFLLVQLTLANPGIGAPPEYWEKYWTKFTLAVCNLDLHLLFKCEDEYALIDLKVALFPYILHGSLNGSALADSHIDFLAYATSPYILNLHNLESKIETANKFIRKMRNELKDTNSTAWSDYPLINVSMLSEKFNIAYPTPELGKILRDVSISARQMFFGTLKHGDGQGHWIARPYGIDEYKAGNELVNHRLGTFDDNPELVLTTYRLHELQEALKGHPIKQGWNKNFLIKYMTKNAPEIAENLTRCKRTFVINPEIRNDGLKLAEWVEKHKIFIQLGIISINL